MTERFPPFSFIFASIPLHPHPQSSTSSSIRVKPLLPPSYFPPIQMPYISHHIFLSLSTFPVSPVPIYCIPHDSFFAYIHIPSIFFYYIFTCSAIFIIYIPTLPSFLVRLGYLFVIFALIWIWIFFRFLLSFTKGVIAYEFILDFFCIFGFASLAYLGSDICDKGVLKLHIWIHILICFTSA